MIALNRQSDTALLGKRLAQTFLQKGSVPLFLDGELGAGKTCLTRHLVQNLPGAENAEISSPSFNICNYYPTSPPVLHCDLFRCQDEIPEDLELALYSNNIIVIIEWARWLPRKLWPENHLDISISIRNNARLLSISAFGDKALDMCKHIL